MNEENNKDKDGNCPCKWCKRKYKENHYPKIVQAQGENLFYAQCTNCTHYSPYDFLGVSEKRALENWNTFMKQQKGIGSVFGVSNSDSQDDNE